jgi:hypothetical protein
VQQKRKTTTKRSAVRRTKKTEQVRDEAREMREAMSLAARDVIPGPFRR